MIAAAVLIPADGPDLADQQQYHRDHDLQLPCHRNQMGPVKCRRSLAHSGYCLAALAQGVVSRGTLITRQ